MKRTLAILRMISVYLLEIDKRHYSIKMKWNSASGFKHTTQLSFKFFPCFLKTLASFEITEDPFILMAFVPKHFYVKMNLLL